MKTKRIILIITAVIIVAAITISVFVFKGGKNDDITTVPPAVPTDTSAIIQTALQTTEQPTVPSETQPTQTATVPISESTTVTTTAPSIQIPQTKEEIIAAYNNIVNSAKEMQNGTIHKVVDSSIEITKLPVESIKGMVNKVIGSIAKPSDDNYTITNGVTSNGESAMKIISPSDIKINLSPDGVQSAEATPIADGYSIKIVLLSENASYGKGNNINPVHHESCLAPINLATVDAKPAEITSAQMYYPGATIELTVDSQNRLVSYVTDIPMSAQCNCSIKVVDVDIGLDCSVKESYSFSY